MPDCVGSVADWSEAAPPDAVAPPPDAVAPSPDAVTPSPDAVGRRRRDMAADTSLATVLALEARAGPLIQSQPIFSLEGRGLT